MGCDTKSCRLVVFVWRYPVVMWRTSHFNHISRLGREPRFFFFFFVSPVGWVGARALPYLLISTAGDGYPHLLDRPPCRGHRVWRLLHLSNSALGRVFNLALAQFNRSHHHHFPPLKKRTPTHRASSIRQPLDLPPPLPSSSSFVGRFPNTFS